jgi:cytochrome c peroxidase
MGARVAAPLVLALACTTMPPSSPGAADRVDEPVGAPTIAPPRVMPARYLRTLELDPGGYDAVAPPQGSMHAGIPDDLLLGDLLFHSPRTLGPRARALGMSCDTCHPNGAAHVSFMIDGASDRPGNVDLTSAVFRTASDDGIVNPVSIPSLRGCRYTAPYGNDGRTASLAEFIANVVTIEFDGEPLSPRELAALVRYVDDLDFLPNGNLDDHSRLTEVASDAARRGAIVFATPRAGFDGASCATCHPPSSFFRDGRVHRIGSGTSPSPHALDGGYETPTLLGTAETAPYFHDGRFATLADVVAWFDASFSLGLGERDRADLTAYLESIGAVDRPRDDRPLARRLDQTFAYLTLLAADQPDRRVWIAALDAVAVPLHDAPAAVGSRVVAMRERIARIRGAVVRGAAVPPLAAQARALRVELARLAADWAGALPATPE